MNGWIESQEQIDARWSRFTFEAAKIENCLMHTTEAEADRLHELIEQALEQDKGLPFISLSDVVQIHIAPNVARYMDAPADVAPWQTEAEAQERDYNDLKATEANARY